MGTIYAEIKKSRVAASAIEYAQQAMGVTKEIFFKWADVYKPLSNMKGGDTGFKIFQMGNIISNRIYFMIAYNGNPVTADWITARLSRPTEVDEIAPGDFLEADVNIYRAYTQDGDPISGLYYVNIDRAVGYDWYGDRSVEEDPILVNAPVYAGEYLIRVDANFTTPPGSPHDGMVLDNTWMDDLAIFDQQLSADAFPVITVLTTYTAPLQAGTSVPLRISIVNEMYSKPVVTIQLSISTDTGFVIASRDIVDIRLPSDEDGSKIYSLNWTPSTSTPSGTYDLIVTIVETNGDTTSVIIPAEITSQDPIANFIGVIIAFFGSLLAAIGLGAFAVSRRKKGIDIGNAGNINIGCSASDLASGTCSINADIKISCDENGKNCKISL
jgi:hypothetical protein